MKEIKKEKCRSILLFALASVFSLSAWATPDSLADLIGDRSNRAQRLEELQGTRDQTDSLGEFLASAAPVASFGERLGFSAKAERGNIVNAAFNFIGVPYRFGGNGPQDGGFDCSGLVRSAVQRALGQSLPRRASEQAQATRTIAQDELQPGDLVFFNTMRRAFSHVGIYVGDNKFIHAPSSGKTVRVENMNNNYWQSRFNGARRIEVSAASVE